MGLESLLCLTVLISRAGCGHYLAKSGLICNIKVKALIKFDGGKTVGVDNNIFIGVPGELEGKFIGRSSVRIVPGIGNGSIDSVLNNYDALNSFIDIDERFSNDVTSYVQSIDNALREPVFSGRSADTFKIFQDFIRPLNTRRLALAPGWYLKKEISR